MTDTDPTAGLHGQSGSHGTNGGGGGGTTTIARPRETATGEGGASAIAVQTGGAPR